MDRTLAIIGQIYDAAVGEEQWSRVLCNLADHCSVENAALVVVDNRLTYASVTAPRADPDIVAAYNATWWEHDPTVKATSTAPVGQLTSLADTGRKAFERSAFHNEFWLRSGLGAERIATNLLFSDEGFASCVLQASTAHDEVDKETFQRFSRFTPHLIRALSIQRKIQQLEAEKASPERIPAQETRPQATLVVDSKARLLYADKGAERLLAHRHELRLTSGVFSVTETRAHARLMQGIAAITGSLLELPATRPISLPSKGRDRGLFIEIMPCPRILRDAMLSGPLCTSGAAAVLYVYEWHTGGSAIRSPGQHSVPRVAGKRSLFTSVKLDIRQNLSNPDLSLSWLANRHGVTPRYIRNLFYKGNTSFTDWLLNARLDHARTLLASPHNKDVNIAAIALESGFGDLSWFHKTFRRRFGMTPLQMREKG